MKRRSGLTAGAENVGTKRAKKFQRDDAQQAGLAAAPPDSAFNATSAGTAREMSSSMQVCRTPTKTMDAFVSQRSSVAESPFHLFASGLHLTPTRSASGLATLMDGGFTPSSLNYPEAFTPSRNALADKLHQEQILSPTEKHNILMQKSLGPEKHTTLLYGIGQSPASVTHAATAGICINDESFSPFIYKENPKEKDTYSPFVRGNRNGRTPRPRGDESQEPASVTGEVGTSFTGRTPEPRKQNLLGSQRRLIFELNPNSPYQHGGPTRPLEPDSFLQGASNDSIAISSASAASAVPLNADLEHGSLVMFKLLRESMMAPHDVQQAPEASALPPPPPTAAAAALFSKQEEQQQQPKAIAAGFAAAAAVAAASQAQSSAAAPPPAVDAAASEAATLQPEALPMLPTPPAPMSQQSLQEALKLVAGNPEVLQAWLRSQAAAAAAVAPPSSNSVQQQDSAAPSGPQLQAMKAAVAAHQRQQPNLAPAAVPSAALPTGAAASQPSAAAAASGASNPSEWKPCNCLKSKCIKMYCDCFKMGLYCKGCNCRDCENTAEHVNMVRSQQQTIMQRNPEAFTQKIGTVAASGGKVQHIKGCNCKKSKCRKKYCECFQRGIPCGNSCQCVDCENNDTAPDPTNSEEIARMAQGGAASGIAATA